MVMDDQMNVFSNLLCATYLRNYPMVWSQNMATESPAAPSNVQVLELARLMCYLHDKCVPDITTVFTVWFDLKSNPADWQQQILSGAQAIKSLVVTSSEEVDGSLSLHPKGTTMTYH